MSIQKLYVGTFVNLSLLQQKIEPVVQFTTDIKKLAYNADNNHN